MGGGGGSGGTGGSFTSGTSKSSGEPSVRLAGLLGRLLICNPSRMRLVAQEVSAVLLRPLASEQCIYLAGCLCI